MTIVDLGNTVHKQRHYTLNKVKQSPKSCISFHLPILQSFPQSKQSSKPSEAKSWCIILTGKYATSQIRGQGLQRNKDWSRALKRRDIGFKKTIMVMKKSKQDFAKDILLEPYGFVETKNM